MCARRIDVVRGGAPKFEIDVCCLLYTSQLVSNVINLDFSFRTRILSPSNSSGVLRYESETVSELKFDPGFGILVFRLSDRLPRPPIAQIRRMGTEKSKGAIKKFTAPP